jgi:hypothetical protein
MNAYEQKQEARRERILARADRLRAAGEGRVKRARDMASIIPFGQPILVGHHSEKGDRSYRAKIRGNFEKGFELMKAAGEAEARAASVGLGGISSDDPDAVVKLLAEVDELKARQEAMKARNEAWRKAGNKAGRQAGGQWIEPPCAPYQLSNNSANIRRIEQRIEVLRRNATRETKVEEIGAVKLVENAEANRVQLIFPGKPSAEVRTKLKKSGFRWSPSEGAWQRQLNNSAVYWAKDLIKQITTEG